MSKDITLSPKHGLNPSIAVCFFCGEDNGELALPGKLPGDAEAPRRAVWNRRACKKCREYMEQGIIFISARDGEAGDNPYRTGGWVVVTEEAVRRVVVDAAVLKQILDARVAFIEDSVWKAIGLPLDHLKESNHAD